MQFAKAEKLLYEEVDYDYIIEAHNTPDFCEFIVSMGGDALKFRVYNDGTISEK